MNKDQIEAIERRPLSINETAKLLGVSRTKIKDLLLSKEIDFELITGDTPRSNIYEIDALSVIKWLKDNE